MRIRYLVFALVLSLLLTGCLPGSVRRYLAAEHMSNGHEAEKQGKYDEAIQQYRLALEFTPDGPAGAQAHAAIGQVLERHKNDLAGATREFRTAVSLAPKLPYTHVNLAYCLALQKDYDGAIAEYRAAADLQPNDLDLRLYVARALAEKGDHEASIKEFQKAVDAHPNSGLARADMAMEYNRVKDYENAIKQYQAAIADDQSNATVWNNLAWIYATSEDPKFRDPVKALSNAKRAVELEPQAGFIHDTYAEALYVNGKYADAVRAQEETLKMLRPTDDPKEYLARLEKYKAAAKKHG